LHDDNKCLNKQKHLGKSMGPSWERKRPSQEEMFEDKVRQLMYKRKITFQEASSLVKNGQKSIGEF
jgi:hypothetical protein